MDAEREREREREREDFNSHFAVIQRVVNTYLWSILGCVNSYRDTILSCFFSLSKSLNRRTSARINLRYSKRQQDMRGGFSIIKIRGFFFPFPSCAFCLECCRVAQMHAYVFLSLHYSSATFRRDLFPFAALAFAFAEITRSSRAFCARPWARRPWGRGQTASCWGELMLVPDVMNKRGAGRRTRCT